MTFAILRFFLAADPMPAWLGVLTALIGSYVIVSTALNPGGIDDGLATLVLWQMFCASRGFARHAGAGHFDTALVRWPRARVAAAHLMHSVWPVMVLWFRIAGVEAASARRYPVALEPGRVSALIFVSVMAWSLSLATGRLVTGALWLLLIVAAATTRLGTEQYTAMLSRPDAGMAQMLHAAALTVVCPFLLIGDHLPTRGGVTSVVIAASMTALTAGVAYVRRRNYPLEAAL